MTRLTPLLLALLLATLLATLLARARAAKPGPTRPFILDDELPDEDDTEMEERVAAVCQKAIDAIREPEVRRLWGSYFTAGNPDPVFQLPTRRITGINNIEHFFNTWDHAGVSNFTLEEVSPVVASPEACAFSRVAVWTQDGCVFRQPAHVTAQVRPSSTQGMGLEIVRWEEMYSPSDLADQYAACDREWKARGKRRTPRKHLKQQEVPELAVKEPESLDDLSEETRERVLEAQREAAEAAAGDGTWQARHEDEL